MMRRVPHLPLPTTTFVNGKTPRPQEGWSDHNIDNDTVFAWGCDLFDAGCFFEAHELWERLWLRAKAEHDVDDEALLHGLIRLAAAGVKLSDGNLFAVRSHVAGARGYFAGIREWTRGMGSVVVEEAAEQLLRGAHPCLR